MTTVTLATALRMFMSFRELDSRCFMRSTRGRSVKGSTARLNREQVDSRQLSRHTTPRGQLHLAFVLLLQDSIRCQGTG